MDLSRVKPALQAIAAKEADLRLAHIALMQDIRQVLTPNSRSNSGAWSRIVTRDEGEHH